MLEKRGMSAYALHKQSGLHQSVISKIKNNKSKALQLDVLDTLCAALNCQPADLIVYESEITTQTASATQNESTTQNTPTTQIVERTTQNVHTTQPATDNVMTFADALSELKRMGNPKSDSSLRRYLKSKKLKGERLNGEWEIKKSDFENFIHSDFFKTLK